MVNDFLKIIQGEILEEEVKISLSQLCRLSNLPAESILEMMEYGVIEPYQHSTEKWLFKGDSVYRLRCAQRLKKDLHVNTAGAALALDLLQEMKQMRMRLRRLEEQLK
ncbi:MAG: MerR family transcriptional regulator [Gammaproteobacteria bacterium]|nr:MerR family transcriptional regulator [Gammaproteobacteria bacterium]